MGPCAKAGPTSIHGVMNHVIEFESADRAYGVVYCRAEHEAGDKYIVQAMQYWIATSVATGNGTSSDASRWPGGRPTCSSDPAASRGCAGTTGPPRPRSSRAGGPAWDEFWSGSPKQGVGKREEARTRPGWPACAAANCTVVGPGRRDEMDRCEPRLVWRDPAMLRGSDATRAAADRRLLVGSRGELGVRPRRAGIRPRGRWSARRVSGRIPSPPGAALPRPARYPSSPASRPGGSTPPTWQTSPGPLRRASSTSRACGAVYPSIRCSASTASPCSGICSAGPRRSRYWAPARVSPGARVRGCGSPAGLPRAWIREQRRGALRDRCQSRFWRPARGRAHDDALLHRPDGDLVPGVARSTPGTPAARQCEASPARRARAGLGSLPLFFPAVEIEGDWYGDGGIRLHSPLAPAVHLGAGKVIAVSTRHGRSRGGRAAGGCPATRRRLSYWACCTTRSSWICWIRMPFTSSASNRLIAERPASVSSDLRPVELLVLRPSEDLATLARDYEPRLPRMLRELTRRLGTRETRSPDILSIIMFQGDYIEKMIDLGAGGRGCARRRDRPHHRVVIPRALRYLQPTSS